MKTPASFLMNFMTVITIAIVLYMVAVVVMAINTNSPFVVYQFPWPPVWQGGLLILATVSLLYGVRRPSLPVAWGSWGILTFLSVLFTFGLGLYLIPVDALLLILLAFFSYYQRRTQTT